MDFARRCTAASLIGVGRSIPLGDAVLRVFRRRGAAWAFSASLTVLPALLRKVMGKCGESHLAGSCVG